MCREWNKTVGRDSEVLVDSDSSYKTIISAYKRPPPLSSFRNSEVAAVQHFQAVLPF